MDLSNQILLYLLLVTAGQGFVLSAIVGIQKPRFQSFGFLALFFLLFSLGCADKAIDGIFYTPGVDELPFPLAMPLAYSPTIYLHLRLLLKPELKLRLLDFVHYIPAFLLDWSSFFLVGYEGHVWELAIMTNPRDVRAFFELYDAFFIFHFIVYAVVLVKLRNSERAVEPTDDGRKLVWIERFIPMLTVFWVSWVLVKIIGKMNIVGYSLSYFVHAAAMVGIYWFGYSFLLQMRRPFSKSLKRELTFDRAAAREIVERIESAEIFKNQKVTLSTVAGELGLSQQAISMAVNACCNSNFNEFINGLRIEAFKGLLTEPGYQKLSLFGIAQEVGFSSKASFHRAFKKSCGQTPKEYASALST